MDSASLKTPPDRPRRRVVALGAALFVAGKIGLYGLSAMTAPPVAAADGVSTQKKDVGAFTKVSIEVASNVHITQAAKSSVSFTAEPAVMEKLRAQVSGDTLRITSVGSFQTQKPLNVDIVVQQLDRLEIGSAADVIVDGLKGKSLTVAVKSAADVALNKLNLESIRADLLGTGTVTSSGRSSKQQVLIGGTGTYDAKELQGESAKVEISGSGDASFGELKQLHAKVSGAGTVRYRGNPQLQSDIAGAGSIEQM
jgi:hypothetical protein